MDDLDKQLKHACATNNIYICHALIQRGYDVNLCLIYACNYSDDDVTLVQYIISCGADDFELALQHACSKGHIDIAHLLVNKCNHYSHKSVYNAIKNGYAYLTQLILSWYYDKYYPISTDTNTNFNSWPYTDYSDYTPCDIDELINFMTEHYALSLNECLFIACKSGLLNIVKFLINCGATDLNSAFIHACMRRDNESVMQFLLQCKISLEDSEILLSHHYITEYMYNPTMLHIITVLSLNHGIMLNNEYVNIIKQRTKKRCAEVTNCIDNLKLHMYDDRITTNIICEYVSHEYFDI